VICTLLMIVLIGNSDVAPVCAEFHFLHRRAIAVSGASRSPIRLQSG